MTWCRMLVKAKKFVREVEKKNRKSCFVCDRLHNLDIPALEALRTKKLKKNNNKKGKKEFPSLIK